MKIVRVRDVKMPVRGTKGSAGIDFFIPNNFKPTTIYPGESINIPSGVHVLVPEGKALINFNKSGIAVKKNLLVGACVIDSDYQGEIHLNLINVGSDFVALRPGDKILQSLLIDVSHEDVEEVATLSELYAGVESERGTGAFGSTGTK